MDQTEGEAADASRNKTNPIDRCRRENREMVVGGGLLQENNQYVSPRKDKTEGGGRIPEIIRRHRRV